MADFVAVLKKTIEGLSENTPETRDRVYSKARATIDAKLAALNPQPPAAVIARQRQAIDDAIHAVESHYTPASVEEDELDSLFETYHSDADKISEALDKTDRAMPRASNLPMPTAEPVDTPFQLQANAASRSRSTVKPSGSSRSHRPTSRAIATPISSSRRLRAGGFPAG